MFVELLSQFARSPEWYGMHRSGLNWVLSPVKFGNPPPVLGINIGGASHIDVLACLALAVIYFLAFTEAYSRAARWPVKTILRARLRMAVNKPHCFGAANQEISSEYCSGLYALRYGVDCRRFYMVS